ncbi:MAG: PD40 domain-containing protein [Chromatiales bacterium]|nr:PD40 domain-containing protein [Chromatiales bacterium]
MFQSFRDGHWGLWRMAAGGGRAEPLLSDGHDQREPVFTPDGRALLFSSDRAGQSDIWRLALADGELERLTLSAADDYYPAVSPEGQWLAFVSERDGSPALWLQPLATGGQGTGEARALLSAARIGPPAFSVDGGRLALPVAREAIGFPSVARWELLLLDLASGSLEVLSAAYEDVFPFAPQWDSAGGVWYTADGGLRRREPGTTGPPEALAFNISLPVKRAPEPRPVRLDLDQESRPALGIVEPVAGPGGVVFVALGDLWLRRDDGELVQLTDDPWVQRDPVFSPDGRQLAWVSDRGGAGTLVWRRDWPDGTPEAVTGVRGGVRFPVFSPDGRELAFQQPGPRGTEDFRVQLLDLETGRVRRIPAPGLWPGRMGFSADGRRLLVSAPAPPSARFRDGYTRPAWIDLAGEQPPEPLAIPGDWSLDGGVVVAADGGAVTMLVAGAACASPGGLPRLPCRR